MELTELWINRGDLRDTDLRAAPLPTPGPGQVLVAVDKFALTANNISYALTGETIGYWRFFPAEGPWGKMPVWGFGDVVASNVAEIPVGERLWGFFPTASHVILQPTLSTSGQVIDRAPHRADLPPLYNAYIRTSGEPAALKPMEDARCLFLPLFATSFIAADFYADNAFFGVETLIIGSASSKTGFGMAAMLRALEIPIPRLAGLTSPGNRGFVEALGYFDEVAPYGEIEKLPVSPAAFVDMAGDSAITARVHHHFGESLKVSTLVGATHWEAPRDAAKLPGAKPQFFFAPAQFGKRAVEWGEGEPLRRASIASLRLAAEVAHLVQITHQSGPEKVQAAYLHMLEGAIPPSQGIMLAMHAS